MPEDTQYIDDSVLDEMASRARARANTVPTATLTLETGEASPVSGEYVMQTNEDDVHFLVDAVRRAQQAARANEYFRALHEQATLDTEKHFKDAVALRDTNSNLNVTLERTAATRDQLAAENRNLLRAIDLIAYLLPTIDEDAAPTDTYDITDKKLTAQAIRQIQIARDPEYYAPHRIENRKRGE